MASDRLGGISAFVKVAELGSFASAGRALGISPSAVSKSVLRLEARLGLRLFQRTTRSLALTEDGRVFHERCSRILLELDLAEQEMLERSAEPGGVLRIEMPVALGRLRIVPALGGLTSRYPKLQISATFADALTDPIAAGLDAVVRIGFPGDPRLMVKRVGVVRYIVCAAPAYLAARGAPLSVDDLDHHDCIRRVPHNRTDCAAWWFARPGSSEAFRRQVSGTLSFNNNDAIVDAALAGVGLVQLHSYMAEPHLASGALVQVLGDYAVDGPPISVLFPSSRNLAPKVRVFINFVAEALAPSGPTQARGVAAQ